MCTLREFLPTQPLGSIPCHASLTVGQAVCVLHAARHANFQSLLDAVQTTSEKIKVITQNTVKISAYSGAAYFTVSTVLNSDIITKAIAAIMKFFWYTSPPASPCAGVCQR